VIDQAQLAEALGQLDPGTRALLDLSLRRAIPDDQVAKVLGVDAGSIPPRRARGIAQLADIMEVPGPAELAALLIAMPELPEDAWGVPTPAPFAGRVSSARRAKALRRVAVAASPLVAVGAVMAAVVVASSSDHSVSGSVSGGSAGAGARAAVTASAPEPRHGLPPGVQLAHARRPAHRAAHHRARRAHHHASEAGLPAILARQPGGTVEHSVPVSYHPPAAPQQPRHVTHHHAPTKPKASPQPAPAPVQTPSQPVSTPAPTQTQTTPAVQVSPPQQTTTVHSSPWPESGKGQKTPPPQPNLDPPSGVTQQPRGGYNHSSGNNGGGGCSHHGGSYSHDSGDNGQDDGHDAGGGHWHPPGLFRKRH
jgi:hypothetical protein